MKTKQFTAVIPFFNEEKFLSQTIESFFLQEHRPSRLILIDNGSTDSSLAIAKRYVPGNQEIEIVILEEKRPGKIFALEQAVPYIQTEFVIFGDADTIYPPEFITVASKLFKKLPEEYGALLAIGKYGDAGSFGNSMYAWGKVIWSKLLPKKCHSGGYGQVFRTEDFIKCGGYHSKYWKFVLMDHEIIHRFHKVSKSYYHPALWVNTSDRRTNRKNVRWNTWEQILYLLTPFRWEDWFFYSFFTKKLELRNLSHLNLREKPWEK